VSFGYQLDFGYVLDHAGELGAGLAWTLALTAIGLIGGLCGGLVGGVIRAYRLPLASPAIAAFVAFVRATPLFVQIFFLYFGLPELGLNLPAGVVAGLSLVIWGSAYNTENVRAAIEAVPPHYAEAARALGLRPATTLRLVILPVAARFAVPSITTTAVETLKGSSLMLAISFPELTDVTMNLISVSFRVFELFLVLGAAYLLLSVGLTQAMRALEQRLTWPA
jgi:His/Glu/Gln/Arg/opine family amino acid ABC transporter permease subunit